MLDVDVKKGRAALFGEADNLRWIFEIGRDNVTLTHWKREG